MSGANPIISGQWQHSSSNSLSSKISSLISSMGSSSGLASVGMFSGGSEESEKAFYEALSAAQEEGQLVDQFVAEQNAELESLLGRIVGAVERWQFNQNMQRMEMQNMQQMQGVMGNLNYHIQQIEIPPIGCQYVRPNNARDVRTVVGVEIERINGELVRYFGITIDDLEF
jgi:hypothetical protein